MCRTISDKFDRELTEKIGRHVAWCWAEREDLQFLASRKHPYVGRRWSVSLTEIRNSHVRECKYLVAIEQAALYLIWTTKGH